MKRLILILLVAPFILAAGAPAPALYKGRFRPMEIAHRLWAEEHGQSLTFTWSERSSLEQELAEFIRSQPQTTADEVEARFPLVERLAAASPLPATLPLKGLPGAWVSLKALDTRLWDEGKWVDAPNFTAYPDPLFTAIRKAYRELEEGKGSVETLNETLAEAYQGLAAKPYLRSAKKTLFYPSLARLKAEQIFYSLPLQEGTIALYAIATLLLLLSRTRSGTLLSLLAFTLHTLVLALRCYILNRPPVANMVETLLYVPWVTVALAWGIRLWTQSGLALTLACGGAAALLALVRVSHMADAMENVQAVLDSQYWLIIHVLMVVGSYGVFFLSSLLGHAYLVERWRHSLETPTCRRLGQYLLQSLYLGTLLLIGGTVLGGVWAAQSWGRFWDWDPKESWAFISSCVYLIGIHLHRFGYISRFGLAIGSVVGFLAISFTWYGVNYILGTGLHSYGFGNGGELYYYLYLLGEIAFLAFMASSKRLA